MESLFNPDKHNPQRLKHFILTNSCDELPYIIQSTSKHLQSLYFAPQGFSFIKNCNFPNLELLWTSVPQRLPTVCPKLRFLAVTGDELFLNETEETLEAPPKDGFNLEVIVTFCERFFVIHLETEYKA